MTSRPLQPPRPQLQPPALAHPSSSSHSSSSTATTQTPIFTHTHQPYHLHNPHPSTSTTQPNNLTSSGLGQIKTEPSSSPSSFPPSQSPSPTMNDQLMPAASPGSSSSGGELGDDYDDEDQAAGLSNSGLNGMNGMSSATNWEGHVNQPIQSQPIQLQHPHQLSQSFTHGQGHVNPSSLGMSGVGPRNGSGSGSGSGFGGNRGINVADLHSAGGGGYSAAGPSSRNGHGYGQASAMGMAGMGTHNDGSLGVDEDLEAILPPPSASSMGSGPGSAGLGGRFEPWSHSQSRGQQNFHHPGEHRPHPQQQQNPNHQHNQHQQQRELGQPQQSLNQAGHVQQPNHNVYDADRLEGHDVLDRHEEMDGFHAGSNMGYNPPLHQNQQQQQQPAAPNPGPPGLSSEKARTLELLLVKFWTNQMDLAERGLPPQPASSTSSGGSVPPAIQKEEFKNFALPLARIKKVMKSDPEVKMISAEVPVLLGKCCESKSEALHSQRGYAQIQTDLTARLSLHRRTHFPSMARRAIK